MDHIAGDGNISLYVDTTKDHSIRIIVEPCFAVTSVIQPPRHYGHPGTVPNYFYSTKVENKYNPLVIPVTLAQS